MPLRRPSQPRLTVHYIRIVESENPVLEALFPIVYMVSFAVIAGGAFALMTQNLRSAATAPSKTRRHPEAPAAGEEVLFVDLSRERLEKLYEQAS
jgi:hypothetical protein